MSDETVQSGEEKSRLRKVVPDREWEPAYWETSQNPDISLKALGVHTYLMSKPSDWDISAERIAHERKEGRAAIQAAMRELKQANLMRTRRLQGKDGKWSTVTTVYAKASLCPPDNEEEVKPQVGPKIGYRASVDRASVDRASENRSLKKKEPTRKNHINNSSSVVTAEDHAREDRSKEEEKKPSQPKPQDDYPHSTKVFVASLEYYGTIPTPEQYRQIASLVQPLLDDGGDQGELKRQLQADTARGVHSIVGLYLSKLKKMRPEDLKAPQKAAKPSGKQNAQWRSDLEVKTPQRRFEATWCGDCDEKTRLVEYQSGFMGTRKRLCPACAAPKSHTSPANA